MKLRTTAQLTDCVIDGEKLNLENASTIELEFSAIDTGGGFKDPLLDFSFKLDASDASEIIGDNHHTISPRLRDTRSDNGVTFFCEGVVNITDSGALEINGRLKEDQLSDQLIRFVLKQRQ